MSDVGRNDPNDPWLCSSVQAEYYLEFFSQLNHDLDGIVTGNSAIQLFKKSNLSQDELCIIWELADLDKGNWSCLTHSL